MSESQVTTIARQFIEQADPRALQAELLSIIDQLPQANAIMIEHEVITAEEIFAACEVAKPRPLTRSDAKQKKLMSILNPKTPFSAFTDSQLDEFAACFDLAASEGACYVELMKELKAEFLLRKRDVPSGIEYWTK
jgi:hypothetical protein